MTIVVHIKLIYHLIGSIYIVFTVYRVFPVSFKYQYHARMFCTPICFNISIFG